MVSLGCPKALVDSERILTQLRTDGYEISPDYEGADIAGFSLVAIFTQCLQLPAELAYPKEPLIACVHTDGRPVDADLLL